MNTVIMKKSSASEYELYNIVGEFLGVFIKIPGTGLYEFHPLIVNLNDVELMGLAIHLEQLNKESRSNLAALLKK